MATTAPRLLQPQRVPFGTVEVQAGIELPVYVTVPWYRVLRVLAEFVDSATGGSAGASALAAEALAAALAAAGVAATASSVASAASAAAADTAAALDAIDSGDGPDPSDSGMVAVLFQRLRALDPDPEVSTLRAQVANLAARVASLEQEP